MKTNNIPLQDEREVRVLFVCLGNICRSPAAEGVLRSIVEKNPEGRHWVIDSAGIGDWHTGDLPDPRMRSHARRRGYDLTHRARQVRESDFDDFDLIIPMDASNRSRLMQMAPTVEAQAKIHPMMEFASPGARYDHVPDPYYEGAEGFEFVLDLLEDACSNLHTALA